MGRFSKIVGSLVLLNALQCFGSPNPGWSGVNHGHGHGWMKVHSNRHHEHSSKLSEAYVKFHGLGGGKGGSSGGKAGVIKNILSSFSGGAGGGSGEAGWSAPQSQGQEVMGVHMTSGGGGGGGGGGWGAGGGMMMQGGGMMGHGGGGMMHGGGGGGAQMQSGGGGWGGGGMMMPQASSMMGWGQMMPMQGGGGMAKPTGWASAQGSPEGQMQQQQPAKGWQAGDFSRFRPSATTNDKGPFSFELPQGKPAWINKLKPLIDLPKLSLKGWGWRK